MVNVTYGPFYTFSAFGARARETFTRSGTFYNMAILHETRVRDISNTTELAI